MAQFKWNYVGARLKKYGQNLMQYRLDEFGADVRQFISSRLNLLSWKISTRICRILNRPIPIFARDNIAMFTVVGREYSPRPYPGQLLLFRAEDRPAEYGNDATLGWSELARNGIVVHPVAGSHVTIMRKPQVYHMVESFKNYLADASG
jgi:thioesterase domain-containing protein